MLGQRGVDDRELVLPELLEAEHLLPGNLQPVGPLEGAPAPVLQKECSQNR